MSLAFVAIFGKIFLSEFKHSSLLLIPQRRNNMIVTKINHRVAGGEYVSRRVLFENKLQTKKELTEAADIGYTYQGGIDFFKFIYQ